MPETPDIRSRKADHLALCIDEDVGFSGKTSLFDDVELVHDALPELSFDDVDLSVEIAGKRLRAPLLIAAMTGGTPRAEAVNRDLATVAEEAGIGFAFGSQRPLLLRGVTDGYRVRDVAPSTLVLGNIGVVQARETATARLRELLDFSGADALCVHLNPAQEAVQPEGDRDFRGGYDTIARLVDELGRPVIVKETGCGLSRAVVERLVAIGVHTVDVGGAGGTSWVAVETKRAKDGAKALGERFWDWGIPTGAAVAGLAGLPVDVIATGGVATGLDIAKALALGAKAAGVARPFLQAQAKGIDTLRDAVAQRIAEVRLAHLLTGSRTPAELARAPIVMGPRLARWVPPGSPLRARVIAP